MDSMYVFIGSDAELRQKRFKQTLTVAAFMNVVAWLLMVPARPELILRATRGNARHSAWILAALTSAASFMEFLVTPLLGQLSDRYGRRPFLLACPIICCALRFQTFLACDGPLSRVVVSNCLDRCISGSVFPLFLTVTQASFSDLALGDDLAALLAGLEAKFGLAVAMSPVLGALIAQWKNPKYCALAAASVSAVQYLYVFHSVRETLGREKRRPVEPASCNPFSFVRLWKGPGEVGKQFRLLSSVLLLSEMPLKMHDMHMVLLKTRLGFGRIDISRYMLGSGLSITAKSVAAKLLVPRLGSFNATRLSLASTIFSLVAWSSARRGWHIAVAQATDVLSAGGELNSMVTTMAVLRGMGKGDIAASIANQRTLAKVVMPLLYSALFTRFGQRIPFLVAAAFVSAAALIFNTAHGQKAACVTGVEIIELGDDYSSRHRTCSNLDF